MARRITSQPRTDQAAFLPRRKVLMVDEDPGDLRYYAAILEEQGYEVSKCVSCAEGERCLQSESFDFVVVNQGTRAFEARSLVERVLMIDRRTPVLVLTRCVDMGCYLEAMQMGAVDYLEKPLTPAEFLRVVQTHLRSHMFAA